MSVITVTDKRILLVTDRDDIQETVEMFFSLLPGELDTYPEAAYFADTFRPRRSSTEAAQAELEAVTPGRREPILIILDGTVRRKTHDVNPGTGEAATAFLGWLEKHKPEIPVLVLSSTSLEGLELQVLARRNVALLDSKLDGPNGAHVDFAETLAGLVSPKRTTKRRITIEVGSDAAIYHIRNGHYEFVTGARAYSAKDNLNFLIGLLDQYSPYGEGHVPKKEWRGVLSMCGKMLFDVLIGDTIGPHLREMLQIAPVSPGESLAGGALLSNVELRFEINGDKEDAARLFNLPFELATPNVGDAQTFLCTRVPMARRIRLSDQGCDNRVLSGPRCVRPLRVLFVNASVSGTVTLVYESTGAPTQSQWLDSLQDTEAEFSVLDEISRVNGGAILEPPVRLGGGPSPVVGIALRNQIREHLLKGRYDIFHFSGHSTTLSDGSTFLILPGENGEALRLSVRAVAEWARDGGCRLVTLSSCRGSSVRTAIETMRRGVEAVVGFRWDVDERICIDYFREFYRAYLIDGRSISEAYCEACHRVHLCEMGSPLWASAVAVVRD
ncbi:CHAT domain-containing protein [Burkholderia ubonensis]|uniref:CHAT domain-containing protein n=1 Tax=Burkholderia ubonensis TaxID=101571 RepID=A0A107F0T4_9BURK|nr:CHAT domain-containing protein [Burkholderia ubonensis]KWD78643.1 hypothetical protein WL70_21825 [Burkholderia ubonensis]KWD84748.1 hypothetical protein WL71_14170 [Burkholderia ubonensis]KWD90698.1 hypothetical protein WL72_30995 [Burkholderia ubonensis]KWD96234.1 hypothetical protein WL73_23805 [Burkholderia ubonensis]